MKLSHKTWRLMSPNYDKNEYFEVYYQRMMKIPLINHIPNLVFRQWIFGLYQDYYSIKNYSWLDFSKIEFELIELNFSDLSKLYVIEEFREYVELRASYIDFDDFCCTDEDLDYWIKNGTWRIPPIVLDTNSIKDNIPNFAEISNELQLVEGHSRFGYLQSVKEISKLNKGKLAEKHKVFLMKICTNA